MFYLKTVSEIRQRFSKIKYEIAEYWLDRLIAELLPDKQLAVTGKIVAVLRCEGEEIIIPGLNIVTNDGDTYYAQAGNPNDTPTNDFGGANGRIVVLDNTGAAPAKTSNFSNIGAAVGTGNPKAFDTGYPKSNDNDTDNTGAAVDAITYRTSYTTSEANGTIDRLAIHLNGATGTDPILSYGAFAAQFTKASTDTLKVFNNHTMNGV